MTENPTIPTYAKQITYRDPLHRKWYSRLTAGPISASYSSVRKSLAIAGAALLASKLGLTVVTKPKGREVEPLSPSTLPVR